MLQTLRSVASLLAGVSALILGNSLLGITLPIRLGIAGYHAPTIGLVMAAYFAGLVVGSLYGQRLIGGIGHVRAFAAFAAIASIVALLHAMGLAALPWAILRFTSGVCMAGLFATIESWLNLRSANETRGRILSLYQVTVYLAAGVGQLLVNSWSIDALQLFCLSAVLLTLSLVPVVLTRVSGPEPGPAAPLPFRDLRAISPLGVAGAFGAGLMGGGFFGMGAVFGHAAGLTVFQVSLLMGAATFGGLLLQWPIGRLSDRSDRRTVLLGMLAAEAIICLLQFGSWIAAGALAPLLVLAALFGGVQATIYPISVAHAFDYVERHRMVAASSGLLLAWAIGATCGRSSPRGSWARSAMPACSSTWLRSPPGWPPSRATAWAGASAVRRRSNRSSSRCRRPRPYRASSIPAWSRRRSRKPEKSCRPATTAEADSMPRSLDRRLPVG